MPDARSLAEGLLAARRAERAEVLPPCSPSRIAAFESTQSNSSGLCVVTSTWLCSMAWARKSHTRGMAPGWTVSSGSSMPRTGGAECCSKAVTLPATRRVPSDSWAASNQRARLAGRAQRIIDDISEIGPGYTECTMSLNWSQLQPLRPALGAEGPDLYVEPPHHTGSTLARRLGLEGQRMVLWGPVGSGKSTELRAAARRVDPSLLPVVVPLDLDLDLRKVPQEWELHAALATHILTAVDATSDTYSAKLTERLKRAGLLDSSGPHAPSLASAALTRELLSELGRRRRVALLLDGLEKATTAIAKATMRTLAKELRDTNLVVVASPAVVTGPDAYELIQDLGFRQQPLRPVIVDPHLGNPAEAGRRFMVKIALKRLGEDAASLLGSVIDEAVTYSGGIPRTFLQLLRDAHTAAALAGRERPTDRDLAEAVSDHRSSMFRLLREGDEAALRDSRDTSGVEVPIERRIRLLAQGLMLEYTLPDRIDPLVRPHPLLGLEG